MSSSKQRFKKRKKHGLPSDLSARATVASPRCPSVPALLSSAPMTADGTKGCPAQPQQTQPRTQQSSGLQLSTEINPLVEVKMLSARSAMTPGRLSPSQELQCPCWEGSRWWWPPVSSSSSTGGTWNTEPMQPCSSLSLHQGWHPNFSSTVSPWPTPSVWHSRTWPRLQDGFYRICWSAHPLPTIW